MWLVSKRPAAVYHGQMLGLGPGRVPQRHFISAKGGHIGILADMPGMQRGSLSWLLYPWVGSLERGGGLVAGSQHRLTGQGDLEIETFIDHKGLLPTARCRWWRLPG